MKKRWRVIAVYTPQPKRTAFYDAKGRYSGFTIQEIPSSAAGLEFKFTVAEAADEVEAVAVVMQSGWFPAEISKEFGFVAEAIE
jgi:hypothetical protein